MQPSNFINTIKFLFLKRSKALVIIISIVILFILLLISLFVKEEVPSPTASNTFPNAESFSPLLKTTIGSTTDKEIKESSRVIREEKTADGATKYIVGSSLSLTEDEIYTKDGKAVFESTSIYTNKFGQLPLLDSYDEQFGEPDGVIERSVLYGWHTNLYIYAKDGFALIANKFTREVYEILRFTPMSLEEFKRQYPEYLIQAPDPRDPGHRAP